MTAQERQAYVLGVLAACLQAGVSMDATTNVCRALKITPDELAGVCAKESESESA